MSPVAALDLPIAHISITFAVSMEASAFNLFATHGVLSHFMGGYSILTGTLAVWEQTLVTLLRKSEDYTLDPCGLEACQAASHIWLLLETHGFRGLLIKYDKTPSFGNVFLVH